MTVTHKFFNRLPVRTARIGLFAVSNECLDLLLLCPGALRYRRGVKLSVKSDYAARAVLGLARHYHEGSSIRADDLAAEQGIPVNYLVQILIELKSQQIVKSQRGKDGGYLLAKTPAEITFADVLKSVHGQVFDSPALNDIKCPPELRNAWKRLQSMLDDTASSITFQQLLDEGNDREKMYYI